MKKTNAELKATYSTIFENGYEKTYTTNFTDKVVQGLDLTEEMSQVFRLRGWKGKRIVDVGCGTGLFAYAAAKRGGKVLGIDYTPEAIAVAQSKYQHGNLQYRIGDAGSLEGTYDKIVSLGTLEHMDDPLATLAAFKVHLAPGGSIVITSPSWINPRGYVLQTLLQLFDAPITLADLHYLTPVEFNQFANELDMQLKWRTFDHDWAHGERLLTDFRRRLPNVLRDAKLPLDQKRIDGFIRWLDDHVLPFDHTSKFSGATGIYIFK